MNRFLCAFVKITAFPAQWLCFRTKIHYKNKAVQGRKIKGSAIIVSNHTSVYDFAIWMFVFFGRTLRCLMAEILFRKNKFLTWFLRGLGGIEIDRDIFSFGFVKESCDVLERGGVVEVFPEARLPLPGEERPLPFKPSAAYIAIRSGAPLIPVCTNGSYFSKKRCHVIIGEPIDPAVIVDPKLSETENIEKLTQHLRNTIMELEHELREKTKG